MRGGGERGNGEQGWRDWAGGGRRRGEGEREREQQGSRGREVGVEVHVRE